MTKELERYVRLIAATVAVENGFTPEQVLGKSRTRGLVAVRHFAIWLAWRWTGAPLAAIGRALGKRHHTSIIYAVGRCEKRAEVDPVFASRYEDLTAKIGKPPEALEQELRGQIDVLRQRETARRNTLMAVAQARQAWATAKEREKAARAARKVEAARALLRQNAESLTPAEVPFYEGGERALANRRDSLSRQNAAFAAAMRTALAEEKGR